LDMPLEDRELPVGIFKIQLGWLADRHYFGFFFLGRLLPSTRIEGVCWSLVKTP
jgi:hypothetical protein